MRDKTIRKIKKNIRKLKKLIKRFKNVDNIRNKYISSWESTIEILKDKLKRKKVIKNG